MRALSLRPLSLHRALARSGRSAPAAIIIHRGHATAVPEYSTPARAETTTPTQFKTYTREEISEIYNSPLLPLVYRAAGVHAANHDPTKIQLCTLMNIKSASLPPFLPSLQTLEAHTYIQAVVVQKIVSAFTTVDPFFFKSI